MTNTARKRRRVPPDPAEVWQAPPSDPPPDEAAAAAADYVAGAIPALLELARSNRLDVLAYLLDMARMEAEEQARLRSGRKPS